MQNGIFLTTLGQMAVLFTFIIIGYCFSKLKLVPDNAQVALSKLESFIFVPAIAFSTFVERFTLDNLSSLGTLLLGSLVIEAIVIPVSLLCARLCSRDSYIRKIFTYGLCFSNFGFMGYAVVGVLFPEIFLEYNIFVLVLWIIIYVWGVPYLLMSGDGKGFKETVKRLINPMVICMIIGIIIGITGIRLPQFVLTVADSASSCMSPLAMMLTGMTVASSDMLRVLKNKAIYAVTAIRLFIFPMIFILAVFALNRLFNISLNQTFTACAICSLAMPLGLNTIVIPGAYGKDTSVASGMAIVSHVVSCISIPLVFYFAELLG